MASGKVEDGITNWLTRPSPHYKEYMVLEAAPLDEQVKTQRNSILNIAERYSAYDMRVFGSVARGESRQTSDADFFGRDATGHSLLFGIVLKQDLEGLLLSSLNFFYIITLKSKST